ncbi:MAG TPA: acetyl-CoA C-acyltransferase [Longimicrobiales bacterium]|nr:acetyl-CoA C-acyltransferase [Longimicrobiales bacterium]
MREAFICDYVRTPIGRYGGALSGMRTDDLAAQPLKSLMARHGRVDWERIDDIIYGCANQAGEDNRNVARMAGLLAGLPVSVPGRTVNRLCGSGLQAVNDAFHAIRAGEGDAFIAGGVESMSRAPWVVMKPAQGWPRGAPEVEDSLLGWRFVNPAMPEHWTVGLGVTAENVADEYGVSREAQDAFALESQRRAAAAQDSGAFDAELVPIEVARQRGPAVVVDADEHPRPDVTLEQLASLPPVFRAGGTVTAGNSSGLNDGAAALLVVSDRFARSNGMKPLASIVSSAVAGVEPDRMGIGPIPAGRLALERAGVSASDLAAVELNEAFAAQALPCIEALALDPERVNPNGGAIALGHPLGCSGAKILTTLVHELGRRGGGYGMATMCIGVGQGIATVVEGVA